MIDVFYFGTKPNLFVFEQPANSLEQAAELSRTQFYWYIYGDNDYTNFDFDWRPAPWESTHIHVFPSQWQRNGDVYLVNKDTVKNKEWHFRNEQQVTRLPNTSQWEINGTASIPGDIDYSWHPDSLDQPYIYHFSSQHQSSSGLVYTVPGATNIKFSDAFVVNTLPVTDYWEVSEEIVAAMVDFSWHPNPLDPPYIYHFGTEWAETSGLVYTVPGATEIKIVDEIPSTTPDSTLTTLDIFFVDRGNSLSHSRFVEFSEKYPNVQKIRYANSMFETVRRCIARANTRRFWVISSLNIYNDFDFTWHPDAWQRHMTHVFPSQWNKWSDTYLINKQEFERHSQWAKGLEEFPNLNFVQNQTVKTADDGIAIYYIDQGNNDPVREYLLGKYPQIKVTRFVDNYLATFKRIISSVDTEYVWILNSICDYSKFDFTWQPEPWQAEMIHVFPSKLIGGVQRQGDTFYIHVASFKEQMYELEILDWFNVINYCNDQIVPLHPFPRVVYHGDSLVTAIKEHEFKHPYTIFGTGETLYSFVPPCLWSPKNRELLGINSSGSFSVVPREAKNYIKDQVYDYPYIKKNVNNIQHWPQDIIFISYDEPQADENWDKLKERFAHARRLHGVQGMHNALVEAANLSKTSWFYAVFAKTELAPGFNFTFSPDYYQQPKHYIFHARNVLNGLEYGHMGVVMYNCELVKNQKDFGIDYTMSAAHAVIPELSAIASFNSNPYHTWRTAFRECAKLSQFVNEQSNIENEYRLDVWLSEANGDYAEWCLRGARDGYEFYQANKTMPAQLKQAFDWTWLQQYFESVYSDINDPDLNVLEQRQESWQQQTHC